MWKRCVFEDQHARVGLRFASDEVRTARKSVQDRSGRYTIAFSEQALEQSSCETNLDLLHELDLLHDHAPNAIL